MRIAPLPYTSHSASLFDRIASEPWAIFLDSGHPGSSFGRYDILVARPSATLVERNGLTEIQAGGNTYVSKDDPIDLVRERLGPRVERADLPFSGGALGYLGYELGFRLMPGLRTSPTADAIPRMAIGIYDWAVVVDHTTRTCHLASNASPALTENEWRELIELFRRPHVPKPATFRATSPVKSHITHHTYRRSFQRLQDYIQAGDCYQANLAIGFSACVEGDPWFAYQRLRQISPTPHAAFLNLPFCHILSASPERFLEVRDGFVATRPIKGTRPRGPTPSEDARLAAALATSPKDRAENVMIVDLLRNDLGKVCRPGSVNVPELFAVESFSHVHHLVSTVTGQLQPDRDALSGLRAAFPGGSITGAPKRRAMEIIAELEPDSRGVYCGSIGYIGRDGDMDCNIAIRTLTWREGKAWFHAGGGIVADSDADAEYQECLDKAAPMFRLMQGD